MDDPKSLDAELFEAILVQAIRAGVIPAEIIAAVQERFEGEADHHAGSDRAERFAVLADMATGVLLSATAPSPSDFRAEQRRRQIRLRTEHIAKD